MINRRLLKTGSATGILPIYLDKMDRKKKAEAILYWVIRILSLIILAIAFYFWFINNKGE